MIILTTCRQRMQNYRLRRVYVGSTLAFLAAILFVVGPTQPAAAQPARPAAASPDPAAEIEPGWQAAAQEQIRQSEYQLSWQEDSQIPGLGAAFQAPNRAHNLRTYFTPQGITVTPRACGEAACAAPPWQWGLQLAGYGRGDQLKALPAGGQPQVEGNRATYNYPGNKIQMWYINDERGLEQGFRLAARPDGDGPLWVSLRYSGDLQPALSADGQAIEWITPGGGRVLRYDSLRATDADGRDLPAHMEVDAGSAAIRLVVADAGAVYPVTIDPLSTTPDWTAESDQVEAYFGYSVSGAGDVNGDGYGDVIVGAPYYDNGQADEGRAFVYHGSAAGLAAAPAWTAESNQAEAFFGVSVSGAGDVNGDGYGDVIVGAPWYNHGQHNEGRAFVFRGSAAGLAATPAWTAESNQEFAEFGASVSAAGDVNGDGYADIIVGAYQYTNGQPYEGRAFVYHGSAAGPAAAPAWTAESDQAYADFGVSVSAAGDVNGDGYGDVIVGAELYDNGQDGEGRAYVYHGSAAGLAATAAWTAEGDQAPAGFGGSVSAAGDVNGDGYGDVIVGAPFYGQMSEGLAFVYHGSAAGLAAAPAWTAKSDQASAYFGWSVSGAGDVNGDGYGDVIVGAIGWQYYDGRVYVYYGAAAGLAAAPAWTAESDQEFAEFGISVSGAGDVNNDGYSDVIVGAYVYDHGQTDEGRAFVYHGSVATGTLVGNVTAADSGLGIQGATIAAEDSTGHIRTTTTNVAGDYVLGLAVGAYAVTASADNYVPFTVTGIDIVTDTTTLQDFVLEGLVLTYTPDAIEAFMEFGDVVTHTVTVENTSPWPINWLVSVRNYQDPNATPISIPAASADFARGAAAPSVAHAPARPQANVSENAGLSGLLVGSPAYGIEWRTNNILMLMTDDPTNAIAIGAAPGAFYAGDFVGGDFSTLYVVDNDVQTLYALDIASASLTAIGPSSPGGGLNWTGLSGDPTSGIMYGSASDCSSNAIFEVDVTSGALTPVSNPSGICLIDIAFNATGELYGVDIISDNLVQIDKASGAVTVIGSLGFDANYAQGMDFDESADILYLAAYNNALGAGELRIADMTTGATTLVGTIGDGNTELDAFGVATDVGGDWASAIPDGGVIPPNTTATFEVVFDARGLTEPGDYTAELRFSGTFVNDVPPMPLTMHLSCPTCGQLEGVITDAWTGGPVSADIHMVGPNGFDRTLTGDSYSTTVQPGIYEFDVVADGYFQAIGQAEALAGMTTVTDFALTPAVAILQYAPSVVEDTVAQGYGVVNTLRISNTGTIPFSFELSDFEVAYSPNQVHYVCPPDSFGYTCLDSNEGGPTFEWIDISATGLNLGLTDDSYFFPIDLPFAFNFYGEDYTQVAVGSNGAVYFEDVWWGYSNTIIPAVNFPNRFIAVYWDDLNPEAGGAVYAEVIGDAPHRKLVVQWNAVPHYGNPAAISAEAILFEGSNNILVQYLDPSSWAGSSATEGIQGSKTVGLLYGYNQPILTPELAICYVHPDANDPSCFGGVDALWATESPMAGSLQPGEAMDVAITFDSSVLAQNSISVLPTGAYTATLDFTGNFDNAVDNGTLIMHVTGAQAAIEVSKTVGTDPAVCASSDMLTVWAGTVVYYCYTVTNTGNVMLPLHDLVDDQLGVVFSGVAYDLAPGASVDTVAAGLTISASIWVNTTNTATWTAYDNAGLSATASASATVTVTPTDVALARFGGAARPDWQPIVAALAVLTAPVIFVLRRRRARA